MKKIIYTITAILAILSLSSCESTTKVAPNGMIDVTAPDAYAYSLYVPQTWKSNSFNGVSMAIYSPDDPTNISVTQYSLNDGNLNANSFWESCKSDYQNTFADFSVTSEGNCLLDGIEAGQYEFTATVANVSMKYMNVIAVKDNMAYVLSYASTADNYDAHISDVSTTIQNFTFN